MRKFFIFGMLLFFLACNQEWSDHYYEEANLMMTIPPTWVYDYVGDTLIVSTRYNNGTYKFTTHNDTNLINVLTDVAPKLKDKVEAVPFFEFNEDSVNGLNYVYFNKELNDTARAGVYVFLRVPDMYVIIDAELDKEPYKKTREHANGFISSLRVPKSKK